jgi:epsilon-lactone hydrolase
VNYIREVGIGQQQRDALDADDVAVTLEVTPDVPHVFQGFAAMLEEGDTALNHVTTFLRTHLGAPLSHHRAVTTADPE